VQFLETPPERIQLYTPYHNRECLHCHAGSRFFEENPMHTLEPDTRALIESNELSCIGCHDMIHDIENLADAPLWQEDIQ
jgi:hypothetical protein